MRFTKFGVLLLLVPVLLVLAAGAYFVVKFIQDERAEQIHYDNDETELVVVNSAGADLQLFLAGDTLDDAKPVPDFDGERIWLSKGNYFLQADQSGKRTYYAVPIQGYRSGTENDGSYSVTVRPIPEAEPPPVLPDSPKFVYIPSGNFLMGDRLNPTEPHYIWTQAFYAAPFETTNAEFKSFIDAPDGYRNDANWTKEGLAWRSKDSSHASAKLTAEDAEFRRFGQPDQPVTGVTWFEANAFCRWLTKKYGEERRLIYALPTEAEWEKFARGPDSFDYPLGRSISDAEAKLYNWRKNPGVEVTVIGVAETPASYKANRFGLYHLAGNVVEWTQTVNRAYNREKPYTEDDRNRDDVQGLRVVRGGSWYTATNGVLAIAYRDNFQPEVSHNDLGFRVVVRPLP